MRRALRHAADLGATFLDTSDVHGGGHAERVLGRLLREYPDGRFQLGSKVGHLRGSAPHPYAGRRIRHQLEQSLENLQVERLDLYTLESFDFGPGDRYLGGAIDQLRTMRELGVVGAIGMRGPDSDGNASPERRDALVRRFLFLFPLIRPDVVWMRFSALTPALSLAGEDVVSFTSRQGAGLVLAAPPAKHLLAARTVAAPPSPSKRALRSPYTVSSSEPGRPQHHRSGGNPSTLTRLALRACVQRTEHSVVTCSFATAAEVERLFTALSEPLTHAELTTVEKLYAGARGGHRRDVHAADGPRQP